MVDQHGFRVKSQLKAGHSWQEHYDTHYQECMQANNNLPVAALTCASAAAVRATADVIAHTTSSN